MKKLFALLALLTLSSCLEVEDVSEVWAKAVADPALEGKWQSTSNHDVWTIVKEGDVYQLDKTVSTIENKMEATSFFARAIYVDQRMFLIIKDKKDQSGSLLRIEKDGDKALQYTFSDASGVVQWLTENAANNPNFLINGNDIRIARLDGPTLAALALLPDKYWQVTGQFMKLRP